MLAVEHECDACGASGMQDQDYSFPMDRKIPLPDDVMRTKTFVLHPTSLEHATEQLEQVQPFSHPKWQPFPELALTELTTTGAPPPKR